MRAQARTCPPQCGLFYNQIRAACDAVRAARKPRQRSEAGQGGNPLEAVMRLTPPNHDCAMSMIREYTVERGITPQELLDVFHEGILAVAEKYPEGDHLRIAILHDALPVAAGEKEKCARSC